MVPNIILFFSSSGVISLIPGLVISSSGVVLGYAVLGFDPNYSWMVDWNSTRISFVESTYCWYFIYAFYFLFLCFLVCFPATVLWDGFYNTSAWSESKLKTPSQKVLSPLILFKMEFAISVSSKDLNFIMEYSIIRVYSWKLLTVDLSFCVILDLTKWNRLGSISISIKVRAPSYLENGTLLRMFVSIYF